MPGALKDNDLIAPPPPSVSPIQVSGGVYNENSPRAVFTVTASLGQSLAFDVVDAAPVGGKATTGIGAAPLYYSLDNGANWQAYTGAAVTAGAYPVLVAVDITAERDSVYEGAEQLQLLVNPGQSSQAAAYSTIVDDGSGVVTNPIDPYTKNDRGGDVPGLPRDNDLTPTPASSPSAGMLGGHNRFCPAAPNQLTAVAQGQDVFRIDPLVQNSQVTTQSAAVQSFSGMDVGAAPLPFWSQLMPSGTPFLDALNAANETSTLLTGSLSSVDQTAEKMVGAMPRAHS